MSRNGVADTVIGGSGTNTGQIDADLDSASNIQNLLP